MENAVFTIQGSSQQRRNPFVKIKDRVVNTDHLVYYSITEIESIYIIDFTLTIQGEGKHFTKSFDKESKEEIEEFKAMLFYITPEEINVKGGE